MRAMLASICLRLALAVVFLSSAFNSFMAPDSWAHLIPGTVSSALPLKTILAIFGIYEIILSIFLLLRKNAAVPVFLSAFTLIGLAFLNMADFTVVFLYVALALAALSLLFIGKIKA